jgi:glycosyltransferase involved in cell wall biosynthesis
MFDIAVVTSVWGTYAAWLPAWAESIIAQTLPPSEVVIADMGAYDQGSLDYAVDLLESRGIVVCIVRGPYRGMGAARNAAVRAAHTEWVMHLDADDTLMPHALSDCALLAENADVICLGGLHRRKVITFPLASTERVLNGRHCSFSCSPFRRTFWEVSPYQEDNDWVDSVFWVGLAHYGARFVPTLRAGFRYRDHEDSFSHQLTSGDRQAAKRQWLRMCKDWVGL